MPIEGTPTAHKIPLMAGILETKDHLIMVDTGFPGSQDFIQGIKKAGFNVNDFTHVLNTHAHMDHVGNNRLFVNARVFISQKDYRFLNEYYSTLAESDTPELVLKHFFPDSRADFFKVAPHLKSAARKYWHADIIGEPGAINWLEETADLPDFFKAVPTPGHTPGHHVFLIKGRKQSLLISGDSIPNRALWLRDVYEKAPRSNSSQFFHSKSIVRQHQGIIMGGHGLPFDTNTMNTIDKERIIL